MASDTVAFFSLTAHQEMGGSGGKYPNTYAAVEIADKVASGQFDLYFCSTDCLRSFLNYCVDELERKIVLEKQEVGGRG